MGTNLSSAGPYQGRNDVSYTSVEEARAGKGPEGQAAPAGTTPVAVEPGDTISDLMSKSQPPLDWNNPEHRAQFLADNPQFSETGGRNPDLIWPGEVVYIRSGEAGSDPSVPAQDTTGDGVPDPTSAEQAATTTDAAAQALTAAENADYGSPQVEKANKPEVVAAAQTRLSEAVQAELEFGLTQYVQQNPDATPQELQAEAERLGNAIQGRPGNDAVSDSTLEYRGQQAINTVSARQQGIDLDQVASGTPIQDGPYTDEHGPFAPNSTIESTDGRSYRIDANGYLANGPIAVDGDSRGNARYEVFENGVSTGQSWTLPPGAPDPETPPQPSAESPVGNVADPPTNNAERSDTAAQAYYAASTAEPANPAAVREAQQAFIQAVRAELATGASLQQIQARYGNDPYINAAIDTAAYG